MKRKYLIISIMCTVLIPIFNIGVLNTDSIALKIDGVSTMILFVFIYIYTQMEVK